MHIELVIFLRCKADKANCKDVRGISGCFGPTMAAPVAVDVRYGQRKHALHKDICMVGLNASIVRWTKQNAATLGVCLLIFGPPWGHYGCKCATCLPRLKLGGKEQNTALHEGI